MDIDLTLRLRAGAEILLQCPEHVRLNRDHAPMDANLHRRADEANEAADEIERLRPGQWIPVNERLPEENTDVLVSVDENSDDCGMHVCDYYDGKFLRADAGYIWGVTHWMPLPEPPEVK